MPALPSLAQVFMMLPGILMALTFHEFGHAWVATKFGDDTPRLMGRVNLNPLAHLEIWGTLLIFLAGFGWAKPVQVNVNRLRPRVLGDILVSLAGVAMNFLLAIVFYILLRMADAGMLFGYQSPQLHWTLAYAVAINLTLVGFNLIPLPPLDGFHVARYLFPRSMDSVVHTLYRLGPLLLMLLFLFPEAVSWFLDPIRDGLAIGVYAVTTPVFWLLGI